MELLHHSFAFCEIVLQRGDSGQLHEGWRAGKRRIDHLAYGVGDLGGRHGESEPPATHAVGLAEGVGGDALFHHARSAEDRVMLSVPDHVAVGLIAEDGDFLPTDDIGDGIEVARGRHSTRRVVG